jgi:hypothetical protein
MPRLGDAWKADHHHGSGPAALLHLVLCRVHEVAAAVWLESGGETLHVVGDIRVRSSVLQVGYDVGRHGGFPSIEFIGTVIVACGCVRIDYLSGNQLLARCHAVGSRACSVNWAIWTPHVDSPMPAAAVVSNSPIGGLRIRTYSHPAVAEPGARPCRQARNRLHRSIFRATLGD